MLKHVVVGSSGGRSSRSADAVSLASGESLCSLTSLASDQAPPRAASYASLSDAANANKKTTIKVYARCLRPDIEYKTLSVTLGTTAREVVSALLRKFRSRHRDPKLFFLSMEVCVRRSGGLAVRTRLALDDRARPAALQQCHPNGYSKFTLEMRRRGFVKVYDTALSASSQYKSLLISDRTTADDLLAILLACHDSHEKVEQFSLYEVSASEEYQRKLHPDDLPLRVQASWEAEAECRLLVRRNPDYRPRPSHVTHPPHPVHPTHPVHHHIEPPRNQQAQVPWSAAPSPGLDVDSAARALAGLALLDRPTEQHLQLRNAEQYTPETRHRSIDSILDENCEKWGNYISLRSDFRLKPEEKKPESCGCGKSFCSCSNLKPCRVSMDEVNPTPASRNMAGYSPVYKYPSINYWSPTSKAPRSLGVDANTGISSHAHDTPYISRAESSGNSSYSDLESFLYI